MTNDEEITNRINVTKTMGEKMEKFETLKVGYYQENVKYAEFYSRKIALFDLQFISDKIAKHFKLRKPTISVYGYRISRAFKFGTYIKLSRSCGLNFGTLCHELNHFVCWNEITMKKYSQHPIDKIRHGTKKWNRNLQKLLRYCKKKNFWQDEIARRHTPKPPKPEPTKDELQNKRLALLKSRKDAYERRIRLSENRIKKLNRQIAYREKRQLTLNYGASKDVPLLSFNNLLNTTYTIHLKTSKSIKY